MQMNTQNPQYITDSTGNKLSVILPVKEYQKMIEELEELKDIRLYDEAKKDAGENLSLDAYVKQRNQRKDA